MSDLRDLSDSPEKRRKSGGWLQAVFVIGGLATLLVIFAGAILFIVLAKPKSSLDAAHEAAKQLAATRSQRCTHPPEKRVVFPRSTLAPLVDGDLLEKAAKLEPEFAREDDERALGFRITKIQPGSLYDLVGLCDGDLVVAVAGERLDTPESALEVYEKARDLSEIEVRLLRGTSTATQTYRVVLE